MAKLGDFIAFQAAISLLKDIKGSTIIDQVYNKCKKAEADNNLKEENYVKKICFFGLK